MDGCARGDVADPVPGFREILVDVRAQRLQRGNVEDPDFVRKKSAQAFCEEVIDRRQKGRERLAGSGRRGYERVTPFADGRPAATLRRRRLAQRFRKPLLNNGVEGGSTHGNRRLNRSSFGPNEDAILRQYTQGAGIASSPRSVLTPNPGWQRFSSYRPYQITSGSLRACRAIAKIRRSRWDARQGPSHPSAYARASSGSTRGSFSWRGRHRLAAACQLLESRPDLSIKEIAAATGFNSTSVFDRFFRRSCGCSPSQCRLAAPTRTPLSASTAGPAGASPEPSTCECGDPHGSGVDLLDPSSTDNGARDGEGSGRLESCTASS